MVRTLDCDWRSSEGIASRRSKGTPRAWRSPQASESSQSVAFMNVSLLPEFEELINQKVQSGQYGSSDEVVSAALQLLKEREAEEFLENLLQEAEESGEPTEMTEQDWDDIRREAREHSRRRKAG